MLAKITTTFMFFLPDDEDLHERFLDTIDLDDWDTYRLAPNIAVYERTF